MSTPKEDSSLLTGIVVATPFLVMFTVLMAVFSGYVLVDLWRWFAVPLGLPALGLAHAVGIDIAFGLLTHQTSNCKRDPDENPLWFFAKPFIRPLLCWATGYLAHLAMVQP